LVSEYIKDKGSRKRTTEIRQVISGFHWERMDRRKGHKLTLSCNSERAEELFAFLHCPDEAVSTLFSWQFSKDVMHLFMEYGKEDKQGPGFLLNHKLADTVTDKDAAKVEERVIAAKDPTVACALARWYLDFKHNRSTALALFKQAAEWTDKVAQYYYGSLAFGPDDIQRCTWWRKALERKLHGENLLWTDYQVAMQRRHYEQYSF
jgi:hypothetical protein